MAFTTENLICVVCGGEIARLDARRFECRTCASAFPVLDDVPLLVSEPTEMLTHQLLYCTNLLELNQAQMDRFESHPQFKKGALATRKNLTFLLERIVGAARTARVAPAIDHEPGFISPRLGIVGEHVFLYAYRDWAGTAEIRSESSYFAREIRKHSDLRSRVAVLGVGTGGIARALSGMFDRVYGVDLSLPALLVARDLLRGKPLGFSLNMPYNEFPLRQLPIRLKGCAHPPDNVQLMVADALRLPIPANSLSCVVSAHLLDLIPDQKRLVREIRRVLKPNGIWINVSKPEAVLESDRPNQAELKNFARKERFRLLEQEYSTTFFHDFRAAHDLIMRKQHVITRFVLRKTAEPDFRNVANEAFQNYFSETRSDVMRLRPRLRGEIEQSKLPPIFRRMDGRLTLAELLVMGGKQSGSARTANFLRRLRGLHDDFVIEFVGLNRDP